MLLEPIDMFATPESMTKLNEWIGLHAPEERAHLYTAAFMSWNLAAKLANIAFEEYQTKINATNP